LVEQAEIAEKSAKKFESSIPKGKWGMNNKGRDEMAQSSNAKGKETMPLSGDILPKTKKSGINNQEFKFPLKQYSFKDEQVVTIFYLLQKGNKLSYRRLDALTKWDA